MLKSIRTHLTRSLPSGHSASVCSCSDAPVLHRPGSTWWVTVTAATASPWELARVRWPSTMSVLENVRLVQRGQRSLPFNSNTSKQQVPPSVILFISSAVHGASWKSSHHSRLPEPIKQVQLYSIHPFGPNPFIYFTHVAKKQFLGVTLQIKKSSSALKKREVKGWRKTSFSFSLCN